jgi:hypothetical protein
MDNGKHSVKDSGSKNAIDHRKGEAFASKYANNVLLEMSTWDLKMTFGELDQSLGPQVVVQHTAMTVPWTYVKILAYLLQINVMGYEASNGRIIIPKGLITPIPKEKPKDVALSSEDFAAARAFYEEFLSKNPEASPDYDPEHKKK